MKKREGKITTYCTNCGNQINDGVKFCTSCGTPIAAPVAEQPPVLPPPQQTPMYAASPLVAVYQEEPISTGGYIGIFLLLMLPIVNLILLIVWACGGCRKQGKANLARALLVWILIVTVLSGLVFLTVSLFLGDQIELLKEFSSQISGEIIE